MEGVIGEGGAEVVGIDGVEALMRCSAVGMLATIASLPPLIWLAAMMSSRRSRLGLSKGIEPSWRTVCPETYVSSAAAVSSTCAAAALRERADG